MKCRLANLKLGSMNSSPVQGEGYVFWDYETLVQSSDCGRLPKWSCDTPTKSTQGASKTICNFHIYCALYCMSQIYGMESPINMVHVKPGLPGHPDHQITKNATIKLNGQFPLFAYVQ